MGPGPWAYETRAETPVPRSNAKVAQASTFRTRHGRRVHLFGGTRHGCRVYLSEERGLGACPAKSRVQRDRDGSPPKILRPHGRDARATPFTIRRRRIRRGRRAARWQVLLRRFDQAPAGEADVQLAAQKSLVIRMDEILPQFLPHLVHALGPTDLRDQAAVRKKVPRVE